MVSVATSFCLLGVVRLAFVRVACVWLGLPIRFGGFGARFGGCRCRDLRIRAGSWHRTRAGGYRRDIERVCGG